ARRHEKDFLTRLDLKYAKALGDEVAKARETAARIVASPVAAGATAPFDAFNAGLSAYDAAAREMVALQQAIGLNPDDGIQGKMRKSAHAMESQTVEANQDALTVGVLQLRRHEKDFQLRDDQKYVQAFAKQAGDLGRAIDASTLDASHKKAL